MRVKLFSLLIALILTLPRCSVDIVLGPPPQTELPLPDSGERLSVYFLDVGQADCALLECGGEYMIIDGGNRDDSRMVVSFLQQQGVQTLEAVVCSHAHEDHVGGLPAVLAVFPTGAVYAPTTSYASDVFDDFLHYADQQKLDVTVPQPGDSFSLGDARVTVLGPVQSYAGTNNTSLVLRVDFEQTSFLFTGDMELRAESDMLDYWAGRTDWDVDVLKVGHHGSDTSSSYRFVYALDPEYAIISVGEDNTYGHPSESVVSRFRDAGVPMFRTDHLGTVTVTSDGEEITVLWENQNITPEDVPFAEMQETYIGNIHTMRLHVDGCSSLPTGKNQIIFHSYQEAMAEGYAPCGNCMVPEKRMP